MTIGAAATAAGADVAGGAGAGAASGATDISTGGALGAVGGTSTATGAASGTAGAGATFVPLDGWVLCTPGPDVDVAGAGSGDDAGGVVTAVPAARRASRYCCSWSRRMVCPLTITKAADASGVELVAGTVASDAATEAAWPMAATRPSVADVERPATKILAAWPGFPRAARPA